MKPLQTVLRRALAIAALLGLGGPAIAQVQIDTRPNVYTKGEFALLPEWCIDSQDGPYGSPEGGDYLNRSPRAREWVSKMGTDFWHMHHYCRGLRNLMKLQTTNVALRTKTMLLQSTVGEFMYVINNCGPTMPLLPEVYLKLGEVYVMQQDLPAAQQAFQKSRELRPDYWPAYDRWAAVLIDLKEWKRARELLDEGLRESPNQPNLVTRLATVNSAGGRKAAVQRSAAAGADNARN
jgi:tetratricopeptide (TPR) repeat protein